MKLILLTAPSGSGKTTIAHALMAALPTLRFSVSATTRPQRPHEEDGVDYHFLSEAAFRAAIEAEALLEYEEVYPSQWYGTLRHTVEEMAQTHPILFDIDVNGALNLKKIYGPAALAVFIQPPSLRELERRLRLRQIEDARSLKTRLTHARHELTYADQFDVIVVNDDLETAISETLAHVQSFLGAVQKN